MKRNSWTLFQEIPSALTAIIKRSQAAPFPATFTITSITAQICIQIRILRIISRIRPSGWPRRIPGSWRLCADILAAFRTHPLIILRLTLTYSRRICTLLQTTCTQIKVSLFFTNRVDLQIKSKGFLLWFTLRRLHYQITVIAHTAAPTMFIILKFNLRSKRSHYQTRWATCISAPLLQVRFLLPTIKTETLEGFPPIPDSKSSSYLHTHHLDKMNYATNLFNKSSVESR